MKAAASNKENAKGLHAPEDMRRRPASARIQRVEEKPRRQEQRTHASLKQRMPAGRGRSASRDRDKTPEMQVL